MHLHLATTPSTMAEARRLLAEGDTQTTLVTTDEQTAGRGRQGAGWITFPAPYALAATFIVRETQPLPHMALVVSLALHQYLTTQGDVSPDALRIKWPNDMLFNNKKVAGILIESQPCHLPSTPYNLAYLIGLGLNLTPPPEVPTNFPGTFLYPSSFKLQPSTFPLSLYTCISESIQLYKAEGWSAFHNNYLRACSTIGQPARWKRAGKQDLTGIARGLTKDGHLELETDDGQTHIIHSGEIVEVTNPSIS